MEQYKNCNIPGECDELLCIYCKDRDPSLREKIFERFQYLPKAIAKRYMNKGVEYEDIYQVACMGLVIAIDRFDCSRGVKFSTYATPTILGEVKRYFRDKGFIIKLPRRLYEIFRKADRIRISHEQQGINLPTVDELAAALQVTDKDITESLQYGDIVNMRSLEETVYNSELSLSQTIGVEENDFLVIENRDFLCESLRKLTPEEKRLIVGRYYKDKSQRELAREMGVSQMQVSRLERKVLEKLKSMYIH